MSVDKKQKTAPGLMADAGDVVNSDLEKNDWLTLQQDYYDMRKGDCIAASTIKALKLPILQSPYRIKTDGKDKKSKQAKDFIDFCFDNLKFQSFKQHCLLSLDNGLSLFETLFERGYKFDGYTTNRLYKLVPIQNETINKFLYNENADFIGIEHEKREPEGKTDFIKIYNDDLFRCTFDEEYNDVRGNSMLRPARRSYKYKIAVMDAATRAAQRGSGIPYGEIDQSASPDDKATVKEVLRTIANGKNCYALGQTGKFKIDLLELKSQGDNMALLEYFDRQMFFNSLSQFMTAGIGGNGSRAATGEHKASYELAANYILKYLKESIQELVNRMIEQSPWYDLPSENYPMIDFDAITQSDLSKVAENIKTIKDAGGFKFTVEDEKYLRALFGMPDYNPKAEPISKPVVPVVEPDDQNDTDGEPDENKSKDVKPDDELEKKLEIKFTRKLTKLEKQIHEKEIFEFESANEHYLTIQERAQKALDKVFKKILADVGRQLKRNPKADIEIRYERELVKDMTELFDESYTRGERDFMRELNKLKKVSVKLETPPTKKRSTQKSIERWVKRLFSNVKFTIEDQIDKLPASYIESKGGIEEYIMSFEQGFKTEKRQVFREVESGYMVGRGASLRLALEEVETYLYSAVLDKNLCDVCAQFDGLVLTFKEMISANLDPYMKPTNLECLGRQDCRCILIPFELKGGA